MVEVADLVAPRHRGHAHARHHPRSDDLHRHVREGAQKVPKERVRSRGSTIARPSNARLHHQESRSSARPHELLLFAAERFDRIEGSANSVL